ncbi:glycosyl transferase [Vibrio sp. HA2012]|uniref:glycosyl transferase n=1 Tax=Vibrio sp. HA2012 TaxID=1971595 RepID=UPI000C2B5BFA|nr:glycosyl transferase [Vibrio sp. HA2012]PJC85215.1 glycosyl transferase [Vibrio sp. HA2012]
MFKWIKRKLTKRAKEKKTITRNIRSIQRIIDTSVKAERLQYLAVNSEKSLISEEKCLEFELVVSLTTYSKRIHDVHLVIESIGQQSVLANRIILWLDENEFTLSSLPRELHNQIARGLEVRFCPNYKSFKKIIPALQEMPDAGIVTIDDDVLYAANTLDILIREHRVNPGYVIGHRGHRIRFDSADKPLPYKQWDYAITEGEASHQIVLTGSGGILYPPGSLHKDVTDIKTFSNLCPHADDLWLKVMAYRQGSICKKTDFSSGGLALMANRDSGLAKINVRKGGNDKQFAKLVEHYCLKLK